QAEDGIRDATVTGVQTCALPISTASRCAQRRTALQKEVVAGRGTRATGVVSLSALGEPATARPAGVAGPTDADDCRVDAGHRARSEERRVGEGGRSRRGRRESKI